MYLRISKEDFDNAESESIQNQRKIIYNYINKNFKDSEIIEFVDDGYSGTNFNRPAFKKMYEMVENQDKDEIVDLEVYRICLFSIEQYVRKFQSDEVPQDDIHEFLQAVIESTHNTQTTSDKTDELKRDILDRVSQTQQAVMRAYGGT